MQRAIVAGLIIPTPEVTELPNREFYDKVYPANYKQPRQLIHMQRKPCLKDLTEFLHFKPFMFNKKHEKVFFFLKLSKPYLNAN